MRTYVGTASVYVDAPNLGEAISTFEDAMATVHDHSHVGHRVTVVLADTWPSDNYPTTTPEDYHD